jgi:hypothetical protein
MLGSRGCSARSRLRSRARAYLPSANGGKLVPPVPNPPACVEESCHNIRREGRDLHRAVPDLRHPWSDLDASSRDHAGRANIANVVREGVQRHNLFDLS